MEATAKDLTSVKSPGGAGNGPQMLP